MNTILAGMDSLSTPKQRMLHACQSALHGRWTARPVGRVPRGSRAPSVVRPVGRAPSGLRAPGIGVSSAAIAGWTQQPRRLRGAQVLRRLQPLGLVAWAAKECPVGRRGFEAEMCLGSSWFLRIASRRSRFRAQLRMEDRDCTTVARSGGWPHRRRQSVLAKRSGLLDVG